MKTDSKEFLALMAKWSREAYAEEMSAAEEEYLANEDMHGRLPLKHLDGHIVYSTDQQTG